MSMVSRAEGDVRKAARRDDWDEHWGAYATAAERNPAQEYRRREVFRLLGRSGRPARLVDIGSGQGDLLVAARRRWPEADLVGVELSAEGVEIAQAKAPDVRFVQCDLLAAEVSPPGLDRWASHAVCSEVLEHVDDPVRLLSSATRFLAPGAVVIVTVPGGPISAFDRHIGHRRHYTPATLRACLTEAGLRVDRIDRAGFPAFNLYRLMVIARGDRLIEDLDASTGPGSGRLARFVMRAFEPLFAISLPRSPLGWQLTAVATEAST